ncbi:hypothetical protein TraAM80_00859 [Trypanosoma rangeli]|uniref:Uncharacterized protein n=1 Tax=Trypanosoma rangeli TaxID=5698 RepID=A0A3R7N1Z4_TRYRA|nr:uncharacterized protein TraAM80_00859 [Trypanosoma rangeli]RNF11531.1 hypothetical protein TraAM80_00859 [Trypanosoma rangeli]|eukprot:RNF11531.1 hypothetical protein TraAM80_00859 [Trypanosoma rangeli]
MAALESLNFDAETAVHYIHCVISDVPMNLALSELAPMVVPRPESDTVKELEAVGCRIVPHQIQMFKERLERKFGFVTFFIHETSRAASDEELHKLALRWVHRDLTPQLGSVKACVALGQPPECYSSVPFLRALREECTFLDAKKVKNVKKLETFLLTKVCFYSEGLNLDKNNKDELMGAERKNNAGEAWKVVGSFGMSSLTWSELLWLVREHSGMPPVVVSKGNVDISKCDKEALRTFLEETLLPLIRVVA